MLPFVGIAPIPIWSALLTHPSPLSNGKAQPRLASRPGTFYMRATPLPEKPP
jgi:hypothetical protein